MSRSVLAVLFDTSDEQIVKVIRRLGLEPLILRLIRGLSWIIEKVSR